jgi:poly(A) polymerase Pap1
VGIPQQRRIQDELTRAAFLLGHDDAQWRSLYQPSDFFQRHANFLQITIRASNSEDFFKWLRLCESRLRILIAALDGPEARYVVLLSVCSNDPVFSH